jgi:hypothetical protein
MLRKFACADAPVAAPIVPDRPGAGLASDVHLWLPTGDERSMSDTEEQHGTLSGRMVRLIAQRLRLASRDPSDVLEMLITSAAIPPLAPHGCLRGAVHYRVAFF